MLPPRLLRLASLLLCWAPPLLGQDSAPGRSWPTATPAAVGLNASVLDSIDAEIQEGRYGYVDRMLVIRHGRIAYDASYPHDYDAIYGDSAGVTVSLPAGGGPAGWSCAQRGNR